MGFISSESLGKYFENSADTYFNQAFVFWLHWIFIAVDGHSLAAVCELLVVVASFVAEHQL